MVLSNASSLSLISVSTSLGEAPCQSVLTTKVGESTAGNRSIDNSFKARLPNRKAAKIRIIAVTGLFSNKRVNLRSNYRSVQLTTHHINKPTHKANNLGY